MYAGLPLASRPRSKVLEHKDTSNDLLRVQRFSMSSQVAAARILPLLLDDVDETTAHRVRGGIAAAITHSVEEVRDHAAVSVGRYLWDRDIDLALASIRALLDFARLERCCYGRWRWESFSTPGNLHDRVWQKIESIRRAISDRVALPERGRYCISISDSSCAQVLPRIGNIIWHQHERPVAQNVHLQIAKSLAHSWKPERRREHGRANRRHYEAEAALRTQFANFVVRCDPQTASELWAPFASATTYAAEEVAEAFEQVVAAEDAAHKGQSFWTIWDNTRRAIVGVPNWSDRIVRERDGLAKLASALLLDGVSWKENARDWKPAHGHEHQLREFVLQVGFGPPVCEAFIRLLDGVGNFLLPNALLWLDEILTKGKPAELIGNRNALFSLSRILTPLVFSRTSVLRNDTDLRDATLRILNMMIEQGSSAAFRMRDFLITPFSRAHASIV